jgi:perosamine synthetase
MQLSFEGIKPPYVAPGVDEVHWMLYVVHLGKRFTASACAQIIDDLATEASRRPCTASRCTSSSLHPAGLAARPAAAAERIADRALALPLHAT